MWFHFQGSFWWEGRLEESCHTASAWQRICRTASPFGVHINFWPRAEMMSWNRGRWAFWQRLQRRPATSGSGQFRPVCQVYGDFSVKRTRCVKQVSMSFMVYMLFSTSVIQIIQFLDQYKIFYSSTAEAFRNAVYLFWQDLVFIGKKWW